MLFDMATYRPFCELKNERKYSLKTHCVMSCGAVFQRNTAIFCYMGASRQSFFLKKLF